MSSHIVAKSFDRLGTRYQPGDALPPDLDKATMDHYLRHGMIKPAETQAVKRPRQRQAAPTNARQAGPSETQTATPTPGGPDASAGQLNASIQSATPSTGDTPGEPGASADGATDTPADGA